MNYKTSRHENITVTEWIYPQWTSNNSFVLSIRAANWAQYRIANNSRGEISLYWCSTDLQRSRHHLCDFDLKIFESLFTFRVFGSVFSIIDMERYVTVDGLHTVLMSTDLSSSFVKITTFVQSIYGRWQWEGSHDVTIKNRTFNITYNLGHLSQSGRSPSDSFSLAFVLQVCAPVPSPSLSLSLSLCVCILVCGLGSCRLVGLSGKL